VTLAGWIERVANVWPEGEDGAVRAVTLDLGVVEDAAFDELLAHHSMAHRMRAATNVSGGGDIVETVILQVRPRLRVRALRYVAAEARASRSAAQSP
jgi:hypothetical protein